MVNYWSQMWERRLSNAYLEKEDLGYSKKSPSKGQVKLQTFCIVYKRNKEMFMSVSLGGSKV